MPEPALGIAPVRSDAEVAAASQLARDFFAYMRATYPEKRAPRSTPTWSSRTSRASSPTSATISARRTASACWPASTAPRSASSCSSPIRPGSASSTGCTSPAPPAAAASAAALCEALIARARALGYREIRLDALNERVEALPLYRRLGFGPDPDPPAYARDEPGVISLRMPL